MTAATKADNPHPGRKWRLLKVQVTAAFVASALFGYSWALVTEAMALPTSHDHWPAAGILWALGCLAVFITGQVEVDPPRDANGRRRLRSYFAPRLAFGWFFLYSSGFFIFDSLMGPSGFERSLTAADLRVHQTLAIIGFAGTVVFAIARTWREAARRVTVTE